MNITLDVFNRVINYLVNVFIKAAIRAEIIGEQLRALLNIFSHRFVNDVLATARDYFAFNFAAFVAVSFEQSHNSDLADEAGHRSNLLSSLVFVHKSGSAADERFIGFNRFTRPTQLIKASGLHRESDSVHQEPSGFLSDAKRAVNLIRTNTVLCRSNHPYCTEPLVERYRRIFHHCSELNREHLFALFVLALPRSSSRDKRDLVGLASRAIYDSIRPTQAGHKGKRVVWVGEINDRFLKRFWEAGFFLCHSEAIIA